MIRTAGRSIQIATTGIECIGISLVARLQGQDLYIAIDRNRFFCRILLDLRLSTVVVILRRTQCIVVVGCNNDNLCINSQLVNIGHKNPLSDRNTATGFYIVAEQSMQFHVSGSNISLACFQELRVIGHVFHALGHPTQEGIAFGCGNAGQRHASGSAGHVLNGSDACRNGEGNGIGFIFRLLTSTGRNQIDQNSILTAFIAREQTTAGIISQQFMCIATLCHDHCCAFIGQRDTPRGVGCQGRLRS